MLKRTLRLSTITLCILCTFFLICTGVFAATRQASQISTTVQFTPGILAKVYVKVDNGTQQLIFDNTNDKGTLTNQYFTLAGGTVTDGTKNNQTIQFVIENHNQTGDIRAEVFYADTHNGWYFADVNGDEIATITTYNAITPVTTIQTGTIAPSANASTSTFHIISLYDNTDTKLIIKLSDV